MSAAARDIFSDTVLNDWEIVTSAPRASISKDIIHKEISKLPLWIFVDDDERVVCNLPVEVIIRGESGSFFAECDRLHVYSDGESQDECINNLSSQVVHFYNYYSALDENEVMGLAQQLRELYINNFSKDNV